MSPWLFWLLLAGNVLANLWFAWCWFEYFCAPRSYRFGFGRVEHDDGLRRVTRFTLPPTTVRFYRMRFAAKDRSAHIARVGATFCVRFGRHAVAVGPSIRLGP